ncbi:hypothetical protein O181_029419 [Austropuccinia psidii MF-1]|uniref:Uncharacterized protein n=1 Tax=Austropuccinia psidii MF-1 TaxID=1389203 RepID=A0A9Q3CQU9_9BASI|nr:hypothetical protein [Austropuccinia psidii MF-1]
MPCEQTLQKPTPGLSGTQWLQFLFGGNHPPFPFLILTFVSSELTLPPFVEPSQHNAPPIPGPSQPSKRHEDTLTCEPEPEVAPTQSIEEPFARLPNPALVIIINNTPACSSPPSTPTLVPSLETLHEPFHPFFM